MKFGIGRTSDIAHKPCEGACQEYYTRAISGVEEKIKYWTIDINTLEELMALMALMELVREDLIISREHWEIEKAEKQIPFIEIYDAYRE